MENYLDQKLSEGLQQLASEESSYELPTAASVWSLSQFRLHYQSRKRRHKYAPSLFMALTAFYLLLFLLLDLRPESLKIGVLVTIAVVVVSAFFLSCMIRRTIRG